MHYESIIVISWDVNTIKCFGSRKASTIDSSVSVTCLEFDLADKNVILDNAVHGDEPLTEESVIVFNIPKIVYGQTERKPQIENILTSCHTIQGFDGGNEEQQEFYPAGSILMKCL